jgi:formylglycine-generating enzyme required for sulfatase activity
MVERSAQAAIVGRLPIWLCCRDVSPKGMPSVLRIALAPLLLLLSLTPALAQKRVALVVGIDRYTNLRSDAQLRTAKNDAAAIAGLLRELSFEVIAANDVTRSAFNGHWQDFLNKLSPGDTAVFFFAGHGVDLGGRNYLLPGDVPNLRPGREELLRRESLSLQEFLADLREKGTGLNLVILDACRDNPFEQLAGRSVGRTRGLAVTEPPEGTFIMFSAGTGQTALDGLDDNDRNPNSVFTRTLLPLLKSPGLTLTDVAEQVRADVRKMAATVQHRQSPAYYNQVVGRVCLAGDSCSPRSIGGAGPIALSEVEGAWDRTKDANSIAALEAFIKRYADTYYGDLAKIRLMELKAAGETARRRAAEVAKAEAERQRLAMLKAEQDRSTEEERRRAEADQLRPGRAFRDCPDVCPEMVIVPAGSFIMGSPPDELRRNYDEGPQRKVTIARPFAVGKFEVTFLEWDACVGDGGCLSNSRPDDQGWGRGRRPVINVSWDDAKEYVVWLSRKTGKRHRLLSEVEWEYAARAGMSTAFWWGGSISTEQANYDGNYIYAGGQKGEHRRSTVPVDSFAPNPWGLYQVHGNVWEWVEDGWHLNYRGAPTYGAVWRGGDTSMRVLRGGSWYDDPDGLRSANRLRHPAGHRSNKVGFRVARTL